MRVTQFQSGAKADSELDALIEAAVELNRRQAEAEGTIRWSEMVRGTNFVRSVTAW